MSWLKKIFFAFTKKERLTFFLALTAALLCGSVVSGLVIVKSTRAVPAPGGDYSSGFLGQPTYINPVIASSEIDKSLVRLIFSNLNDLADKIEPSADGRIWKVRLKENPRWQDGEKLTSDDVIFTIQKIQDQETSSPLFTAWQGVAAQRLSELELQFSLVNPYVFFSDTLRNLYILPKHLFADVPPPNWRLSDYNLKPVGSGYYKFSSYEKRPDGFIYLYKLESWNQYFGDKPLIQNLDFEFFSQKDDLIKNFNSGQIDGFSGLEPADLTQIKRPYEAISFNLPSYYAVFLNQSKSVPLKDLGVRKALAFALNRENLVNEALGGRGRHATGPIPEGNPYFDEDFANVTSSLEAASTSLEQSGWKINAQGFREKTVGSTKVPLELNLTVPQVNFLIKTAELLKEVWEKIGFKINLIPQPPDDVSGNIIKNRDYEMLLFGNVLGKSPDLFSFWHSSERFYPGLNLALYNNKKADSLIESIRQNLDDEKRKAQFNDLQGLIINDYPATFLYSPDYLYIASKNLHGLEGEFVSEPSDIFIRANKWYLKTARVLK
jgi:peptide/nickel transport system substrate-binding protein